MRRQTWLIWVPLVSHLTYAGAILRGGRGWAHVSAAPQGDPARRGGNSVHFFWDQFSLYYRLSVRDCVYIVHLSIRHAFAALAETITAKVLLAHRVAGTHLFVFFLVCRPVFEKLRRLRSVPLDLWDVRAIHVFRTYGVRCRWRDSSAAAFAPEITADIFDPPITVRPVSAMHPGRFTFVETLDGRVARDVTEVLERMLVAIHRGQANHSNRNVYLWAPARSNILGPLHQAHFLSVSDRCYVWAFEYICQFVRSPIDSAVARCEQIFSGQSGHLFDRVAGSYLSHIGRARSHPFSILLYSWKKIDPLPGPYRFCNAKRAAWGANGRHVNYFWNVCPQFCHALLLFLRRRLLGKTRSAKVDLFLWYTDGAMFWRYFLWVRARSVLSGAAL